MANTRGSKLEGLVPTCCAMFPTCVFTSSNRPDRFDIMPAVRMPLIQSAMALRTVSIQQSPSLAEVVDKGLEKVQEKNKVGQKLHKTPPFIDGWRFVCNSLPIIIRAVIHSRDGAIAYVQAGKPTCGS